MQDYTLGYFKYEKGNVGDDLNMWLWPKVLRDKVNLTNDSNNVLIGIGSIFDAKFEFDKYNNKLVLGPGARGPESLPELNESWDVKFVRGPKTLALIENKVQTKYITDPAILISEYFNKVDSPTEIGFIPYFKTDHKPWEAIANELGFTLISPHLSVEEFTVAISKCKFVITEAMHGAIFADSLRIPWFPITSYSLHYEKDTHFFKWEDWALSMELNIEEMVLPIFWENDSKLKLMYKKYIIKRKLSKIKKDNCYLSTEQCFNKKVTEIKNVIKSI